MIERLGVFSSKNCYLLGSGAISSGNKYSSPAVPKFTRISFRPMFSTARTKVPSRGRKVPVFCERIGLTTFSGSPGFSGFSLEVFILGLLPFASRRRLILIIGTFCITFHL